MRHRKQTTTWHNEELNKRERAQQLPFFYLTQVTDMLLLIWPCFSKPNLGFYSFEMAPVVVEFMSSNFSPGSIITFPMTCRCWMVANAWFAWWKIQPTSTWGSWFFHTEPVPGETIEWTVLQDAQTWHIQDIQLAPTQKSIHTFAKKQTYEPKCWQDWRTYLVKWECVGDINT